MNSLHGCTAINPSPPEEVPTEANAAWDALHVSLHKSAPPCNRRALFTADRLSNEQRAECGSICATYSVAVLCDAYATAAKSSPASGPVTCTSRKGGPPRRAVPGTQQKGKTMSKTTAASAESDLPSALRSFRDRASVVKDAHKSTRKAIKDNPMTSDLAKKQNLEALVADTRAKLDGIKGEQDSYVKNLHDKIEREMRGNQPSDASSVLLRRDATDRARKITDKHEAAAVLSDAIANGDAEMAHAIGNRARNSVWLDVVEAYQAAHPDTADSAAALSYVEGTTSGGGYNLFNGITYSAPTD